MNKLSIFYDFDGVIKDSTSVKTEAFYKLYKPYGEEIAEKVKQHHIENGGVSRFEKFKIYHQSFLGQTINEKQITDLANQFSDLVKQAVINSPYVPGALDAIKSLSQKVNQYIITGTPQKEMEEVLNALELSPYFVEVCGSPTNKIEWSDYLINKYHLDPNHIFFIGDALTDYEAAKHHQLHFILREHSENIELFKNKQVKKIKDLEHLTDIIK